MVDVRPLANINLLRRQPLTIRDLNCGVCILLNPAVSRHWTPVGSWGTYRNCLAGVGVDGNSQVLARLNGVWRNIERPYGGGVPCVTTSSISTSWVSRRENTRTTVIVVLIGPCEDVAECTKISRSSESDTGEGESQEGDKR